MTEDASKMGWRVILAAWMCYAGVGLWVSLPTPGSVPISPAEARRALAQTRFFSSESSSNQPAFLGMVSMVGQINPALSNE